MKQMNAFWYSSTRSQSDYLSFFGDLATRFSLTFAESGTETRRLFTEADVLEVARELQVATRSADGQGYNHDLDDECVACLTRLVTYGKKVYRSESSDIEMMIKYCDENNYPVTGIDLWTKGCSTLPAGMFIVKGGDNLVVTQLINALQEFKGKFKDDAAFPEVKE